MRICGKGLPPRAALLLTCDFLLFTAAAPLLLATSLFVLLPWAQPFATLALFGRLMLAGVLCQVVFYYNDLYNLQLARRPGVVLVHLLRACGMLLALLGLLYAAQPGLSPGIDRLLALAFLLFLTTLLSRALLLSRRMESVLVIGSGEQRADLLEVIEACPEWNLRVARWMNGNELSRDGFRQESRGRLDGIIVCGNEGQNAAVVEALLDCKLRGLRVEEANSFYERAIGRVSVEQIQPEWFVFSTGFTNGERKRIAKRVFDLAVAGLLLVPALPAMALVALAIRLEGGGPILFTQNRVGLHNQLFRIYKFRTMRPAASGPARWVSEEAARITRLGAFLRTFRLDELPQLFNILRGEMSLVGPRPEQPFFCDLLAEHVPYYRQRHTVPPGLTGWAQVRYHYGATIEESRRKLEYDLFYVKHLSLWLDLAVLIETVKVVLVGRGAR